MEPLLCFPMLPPTSVTAVLERAGYPWVGIDRPEAVDDDEPEDGWSGAVVCSGADPKAAFALCRQLRSREVPLAPVLVVVPADQPRTGRLPRTETQRTLIDWHCFGWRTRKRPSQTCRPSPGITFVG